MQATDTDLSLGVVMPGVYVQLDLNAPGPSAGDHKALLLGYKTSAGAKPSNTPYLPTGQTDVEAATGLNSMLANGYAHAVAEGGAGAEVWVLPLDAPSAGTASTYKLIFAGIAVELVLLLFIIYHPLGNKVFSTAPSPSGTWLMITPFALLLLAAEETRKLVMRRLRPL